MTGELLTVAEASAKFGVPRRTLRHWIRNGWLPAAGAEERSDAGHPAWLVEPDAVVAAMERAANARRRPWDA